MSRLFRRLRIKSLFNKKFSKYLLYAIGEVLILIFGIVIALQVNNWNEKRQRQVLEISILKALKSDLEQDIEQWQYDIYLHKDVLASIDIVTEHLENELPHTDTLNYHFLNSTLVSYFSYHSGGLETLKTTGINILSNEDLGKEIVDLYTYWYDYKMYLTEHLNDSHHYGTHEIFNTRFIEGHYFDDVSTKKEWDGHMIPIDYESLLDDNEYKYFLLTYKNDTTYYLNELLKSEQRVKDLIARIDSEIQKLENS
jgi:hypothetical protein